MTGEKAVVKDGVKWKSRIIEELPHWRWIFAAVVLLSVVIRIYQLGAESLWIDESFSIRDATTDFTIPKAGRPFYFWILSTWMHLGHEDWILRLPAVIFGVATTVLVFHLGRMIWGTNTGTIAGLMTAISPIQVNHSQEVRMYTLLTITALGAFYFLVLTLRTWKFRYMLATAICTWLAILSHPVACLLLLPLNYGALDLYIRKRVSLWPWIAAQGLIILAWIPWLPYAVEFSESYGAQSFLSQMYKPKLMDIPILWGKLAAGEWGRVSSIPHIILNAYAFALAALAMIGAWIDRRGYEARLAAAWLLLPSIALVMISLLLVNAWVTRYLIFISPMLFLLVGAAVPRLRKRWMIIALTIIILIPPVGKLTRYYIRTDRPEWRLAVEYIVDREQPTDFIALYRESNEMVWKHYYRGNASWRKIVPKDFVENYEQEFTKWDKQKALALLESIPNAPRRWLVLSRLPTGSAEHIDTAVRCHYNVIDYREFKEITIYLFDKPPRSASKEIIEATSGG